MSKKQVISLMKLPAKERRVVLAKDVLKHLKVKGLITAQKGIYLLFNKEYADGQQADEVIKKGGCEVCAIGALFVADVLIRDKITAHDSIYLHNIRKRLNHHFGKEQLDLIEAAFEVKYMNLVNFGAIGIKAEKAINFGRKYTNSHNRMKAIMKNIIENKGTFIP